jgi:hypothetical protein
MSYIDEDADDEHIEAIELILQNAMIVGRGNTLKDIPSKLKSITNKRLLRDVIAKALIKEYVRREDSGYINDIFTMIDDKDVIREILENKTGDGELVVDDDYEFEETDAEENSRYLDDYLLIIAIQKGHDALVKSLVEKGADVNVVGLKDSLPALHEAAYIGNVNMLKDLIEKGANKKFAARDGTAIAYAKMGKKEGKMDEKTLDEVIRILRGAQEGGRSRTRRRAHIKKSRKSTKRQTMRRK